MMENGVLKGQEKEGRGAGSRDLTSRSGVCLDQPLPTYKPPP